MGNPVMEYAIEDIEEGTWALSVKRIHDRLTFVMKDNKENPGEAEQKD